MSTQAYQALRLPLKGSVQCRRGSNDGHIFAMTLDPTRRGRDEEQPLQPPPAGLPTGTAPGGLAGHSSSQHTWPSDPGALPQTCGCSEAPCAHLSILTNSKEGQAQRRHTVLSVPSRPLSSAPSLRPQWSSDGLPNSGHCSRAGPCFSLQPLSTSHQPPALATSFPQHIVLRPERTACLLPRAGPLRGKPRAAPLLIPPVNTSSCGCWLSTTSCRKLSRADPAALKSCSPGADSSCLLPPAPRLWSPTRLELPESKDCASASSRPRGGVESPYQEAQVQDGSLRAAAEHWGAGNAPSVQ